MQQSRPKTIENSHSSSHTFVQSVNKFLLREKLGEYGY